jgi:CcmD family protein
MRNVLLSIFAIAVVLGTLSTATNVYAQNDGDSAVVSEVNVAPQQAATPDANLPFLFAVFIITWAAFFAYIFFISRRQREMKREIEALKRALADRERETAESGASR